MTGRKKEAGNVGEILTMGLCILALTDENAAELEKLGITGIDYEGSTLNPAGYGNDVVLQIHGRLEETYEIYEKRVSTAKN